jgi:hypothetical protein
MISMVGHEVPKFAFVIDFHVQVPKFAFVIDFHVQ